MAIKAVFIGIVHHFALCHLSHIPLYGAHVVELSAANLLISLNLLLFGLTHCVKQQIRHGRVVAAVQVRFEEMLS